MRKSLSILLVLALFVSLAIPASALEVSTDIISTTVITEYDIIQKLKETDTEDLLEDGYNLTEIEDAKSGKLEQEIINELINRSSMSDAVLAQKGYTKTEIAQLRALKGNESIESVRGLLATVTVTNRKNAYYYKKLTDRTYFLIDVSWSWSKEPFILWTDIVGAGWAGNYQLTKHISSTNNRLTLTCVGTGPTSTKTKYIYMKSSDINAGKATFAMNQGFYYTQSYYWVKSGYGRIELSIVGHDNNAEFIFKYGHATLTQSPSISKGGLSLSFSSKVDTFTPSSGAVYGGRAYIKT